MSSIFLALSTDVSSFVIKVRYEIYITGYDDTWKIFADIQILIIVSNIPDFFESIVH